MCVQIRVSRAHVCIHVCAHGVCARVCARVYGQVCACAHTCGCQSAHVSSGSTAVRAPQDESREWPPGSVLTLGLADRQRKRNLSYTDVLPCCSCFAPVCWTFIEISAFFSGVRSGSRDHVRSAFLSSVSRTNASMLQDQRRGGPLERCQHGRGPRGRRGCHRRRPPCMRAQFPAGERGAGREQQMEA